MSNQLLKVTKFIDTETGTFYEKKNFVENVYDSQKGILFNYNTPYVKIFRKYKLPEELDAASKGRFWDLISFLGEDNMLYYSHRFMTVNAVKEAIGVSRAQAYRLIKKLEDLNVIKSIKTVGGTALYVNPKYALYGKRLSYKCYNIFKKDLEQGMSQLAITKINQINEERGEK